MSRDLLVSCEQIEKRYGVQPLFQGLSFTLAEGDRALARAGKAFHAGSEVFDDFVGAAFDGEDFQQLEDDVLA